MKPDDKIILPASPEAATCRTDIPGFVSRGGRYYYSDTQAPCVECGMLTVREYPLCKACCDKADAERYAALPRTKWDGETPLYSEVTDEFYDDLHTAGETLKDGQTLADLRLVICEPVYATKLDSSYFMDGFGPDVWLPPEAVNAIEAFNRAMEGVIISWMPGKTALELEEDA